MKSAAKNDILKILESLYRSMSHEQLVQTAMSIWKFHLEDNKNRNQAGAIKKAEKFVPKKVIAAEKFIELSQKHKNVSARRLFNELQRKYPDDDWKYDTLRVWHKKMKAALAEVLKEN